MKNWLDMRREDFDADVDLALFEAPAKPAPDADPCGTVDMLEVLGE